MQRLVNLLKPTIALALLAASWLYASPLNKLKQHPKTPEQLRAEYIARLQQQYLPASRYQHRR